MVTADGPSATTPPQGIVPRWEWRTFGDRFEVADRVLADQTPQSPVESDEIYVLSVHSDASVKVRGGLMDVKQRLRVSDEGLELWTPILKTGFPLTVDNATVVLTALGISDPAFRAPSYSLESFIDDVIKPLGDLRATEVHKRRTHYVIQECMVEMTEISAGDAGTRTLGVESPDPSLVRRIVGMLGCGERSNVNVARGLKTLVGFGARRYAVIDVGTNSVKFHVGERNADGSHRTIVDRADTTRLGESQGDDGVLNDTAIARTVDAIATMAAEAGRLGAVDIAAVGTAGLRRAPNRAALVDAARERAGVSVEVISGDEEGRLAYLAATSALPSARGRMVVFDSGGGSTQFTFGRDDQIDERFSLDIGAVRISERFGLDSSVSAETVSDALAALASEFDRLDGRPKPDAIVAIGGTSTNVAAVKHGLAKYDPDRVHGTVLDVAEIDRQIELYRTRTADERRQIAGLQPERAEVILGGACIIRTILDKLGGGPMTVSDRGLRHGVAIARFSEASDPPASPTA